ncbi:hypothetical protein ZIOFF_050490 [Zingiber officinale]|uniref:Uncharacterized protein n=1 Tax=Zingiber officinale TaxID=94328 RepID=A0A8J5KTP0_ZINOF|nr:hypothetical protein ZIOFF_050490 [Zingiber officinale]
MHFIAVLIRRDKIEDRVENYKNYSTDVAISVGADVQFRRLVSLNLAMLGLPGICRSQISLKELTREEIMQRERSIPVAGKPSPSSSHGDTMSKNLSSPWFLFPNLNPTSILEPKRSPFSKRPPKAPLLELQSEPIGLAILDALIDDKENGKMVLFGSQLKVRIPSMESLRSPIEFGVKNKESQLALVSPGRPLSPAVLDAGSASATELETLESYTCVISRGSNPKTTHIFDDCVLESCGDWRPSIYSTQEEQH